MSRKAIYLLVAFLLAVVTIIAIVFAYIWLSGGSGEPSTVISAPTLDSEAAQDNNGASNSNRALFRISQEDSEVRFIIEEDLFGQRTTVVGRTDQVAGDILVDLDDPANSQVGTIRVNVRTLATDDQFRNRSIRGQILESNKDEYEFAEFVPTSIEGLPETIAVGDTVDFQITGDLTLRDVTQSVSFDTNVTLVSASRLEGTASTVVTRDQFELTIPEAPGVANVSQEVGLEISFVAMQVEA